MGGGAILCAFINSVVSCYMHVLFRLGEGRRGVEMETMVVCMGGGDVWGVAVILGSLTNSIVSCYIHVLFRLG